MGFFGVKKRHPYPSGQRSLGAKAIIGNLVIGQERPAQRFHTSKALISSAN
jgi:hypothetical protein